MVVLKSRFPGHAGGGRKAALNLDDALPHQESPSPGSTGLGLAGPVGGRTLSLFAAQTGLGSIKPKVWVEGDHLYARTSYPLQALTLFSYARKLHVDRQQRTIELQTVKFWFINQRRVIPFDQVAYIDSRYSDLGYLVTFQLCYWHWK